MQIRLCLKNTASCLISEVGYGGNEKWLQPLRYYPLFLLSFFLNSISTKRKCLAKFLKLRILQQLKCRWQNIQLNGKWRYDIAHFVSMAISIIVLPVSNRQFVFRVKIRLDWYRRILVGLIIRESHATVKRAVGIMLIFFSFLLIILATSKVKIRKHCCSVTRRLTRSDVRYCFNSKSCLLLSTNFSSNDDFEITHKLMWEEKYN